MSSSLHGRQGTDRYFKIGRLVGLSWNILGPQDIGRLYLEWERWSWLGQAQTIIINGVQGLDLGAQSWVRT